MILSKLIFKEKLIGSKVDKHEIEKFVKDSLISSISTLFDAAGDMIFLKKLMKKRNKRQPFLILFVGINGTGKTTSLAKVAHMLKEAKYSVVIAAADTFRAGAIEQLREHTNRLNLKLLHKIIILILQLLHEMQYYMQNLTKLMCV